jgi:glycosyltransferase involved in cell wall biosynthesis
MQNVESNLRALPLVSVIMPAFNAEPYLEDAARSVLGQTYSQLELIIVNDGSTDGTGAVAEHIRRRDPRRVRIIDAPHIGLPAARNAALDASRGEFLALLDSDDIWEPKFLERQMAVLIADPAVDLVTGNGRFLGSRRHGAPVRPWPDPRPPIMLASIIADEEAVFVMTVIRRRVFETIGGFDESLTTNEDFEYWLRAALAGFRFARNAEPLAWYRRRDDSLSANAVRMLSGVLHVCARVRPLLADKPERELLERKIDYYEAELCAAKAREALAVGDMSKAAAALDALQACRPSLRTALALVLAQRGAPMLAALYHLKHWARELRAVLRTPA